ncbi:hypothetical protein LCGC14_2904780, partial [marine sediment metagenome]
QEVVELGMYSRVETALRRARA